MTLEHVAAINGKAYPVRKATRRAIIVTMNGRTKTVYNSDRMVENHVLSGRFTSLKINRR